MNDPTINPPAAAPRGWIARWRAWLAHAFALPDPGLLALTPDETERLQQLAGWIRNRDLALPAVMAIESSRPLASLSGQGVRAFEPILSLVAPRDDIALLMKLLERPAAIDLLVSLLQTRAE